MGKRISDEDIIKINELYAELKVKKRVAEAMGISPSTVSKYIIENYVPQGIKSESTFDKKPNGAVALIERIKNSEEEPAIAFAKDCNLSEEEWADLKVLQRGVLI